MYNRQKKKKKEVQFLPAAAWKLHMSVDEAAGYPFTFVERFK